MDSYREDSDVEQDVVVEKRTEQQPESKPIEEKGGISRYSRTQMYKRRGLYKKQKAVVLAMVKLANKKTREYLQRELAAFTLTVSV